MIELQSVFAKAAFGLSQKPPPAPLRLLTCAPPPFVIGRPQFRRALFGEMCFFFLLSSWKFDENTATTLVRAALSMRTESRGAARAPPVEVKQHTAHVWGPARTKPRSNKAATLKGWLLLRPKSCTRTHHKDYGQRACERKYLFIQATGGSLCSPIKKRNQKTKDCGCTDRCYDKAGFLTPPSLI